MRELNSDEALVCLVAAAFLCIVLVMLIGGGQKRASCKDALEAHEQAAIERLCK